ncbi:MAG: hypothetical protein ACKOA0_10450 [Burkholderiaceae bacterium]
MNNRDKSSINMTKSMCDKYDFGVARNKPYSSRQKEPLLELAAWPIKEIEQALIEADTGEFSATEDLVRVVEKYSG